MKKKFLFVWVLLLLTALTITTTSVVASGGHPPTKGDQEKEVVDAVIDAVNPGFSEEEKSIIKEYFGVKNLNKDYKNNENGKGKKRKGLPPGLAKKDQLPPGLAMQLKKNGHLPPGLEKRELPDDLLNRLPSCEKKGKCTIVGTDILLVEGATERIFDIINNAIQP